MRRTPWIWAGEKGSRYAPALAALKKSSGCYVIRDAITKKILYVGESHRGRLLSTATRHLQTWGRLSWYGSNALGAQDPGVCYERHGVELRAIVTRADQAQELQAKLIARLKPRDNVYLTGEDPPF